MPDARNDPPAQDAAGKPSSQPLPDGQVDLEALARYVYELLKREARIERERLGLRR